MELISVIIPIYKAEKYLDRCIKSITNQTYRNLEIILVDDGSPDRCSEICDTWGKKDNRIKVIHQKNSGVSVARNTGIDVSTGKYIIQVDSDDYIASNMIETLYDAVQINRADMSICKFEKGSDDQYKFETEHKNGMEAIDAETALKRAYKNSEYALQYIAPWGKLYKKELFTGIQYPAGKIFEDIYVTHQVLYRCKSIVVVEDKLTYYYQHGDSIMNKKYHVGKLDYLEACKNRISFFKNNNLLELEHIAYAEYLHSLIWEYSRARDLLADRQVMTNIVQRYREVYVKGYSSIRYPAETKRYLALFNFNPELLVLYWKISAKLKKGNGSDK